MLVVLAEIEEVFKEFIDEDDKSYRHNNWPFYVLGRTQPRHADIHLQNVLFADSTKLDMEIKFQSTVMLINHNEAIIMKEKMELPIGM